MNIKKLEISNFLNFNETEFNFSSGINLFIGENNIGKTGIIKFLYANTKAYEDYYKIKGTSKERSFKELLSIKLQNVFQSEKKIGTIVCNSQNDFLKSNLLFETNNTDKKISFYFKKTTEREVPNLDFTDVEKDDKLETSDVSNSAVFIPTKEILGVVNAIKIVNERFITDGFDDTYNDLVNNILPPAFIKNYSNIFDEIIKNFKEKIIDGEIKYDQSKSKYFYKDNNGYKYDITMTAEGIKQLGLIPLLIKTGLIAKGTVLFLDEPDNNLNPKAIRRFAYELFELANAGVQIFVSTHNHLFVQYISVLTEQKLLENKDMPENKFFALFRDQNNKTSVESENDLLDIVNNLILDEHIKLHDTEQELYDKI